MEESGMEMTVPQVFLGGHLIGGYDALKGVLG
jgi:glutaredoxin